MKKTIAILGSTGSIGRQTLDFYEKEKDRFRLLYICGHSNWELLAEQFFRYKPEYVVTTSEKSYEKLLRSFPGMKSRLFYGTKAVSMLASGTEGTVVAAITGFAGLLPTVEHIRNSWDIALANKEVLVSAGEYVTNLCRQTGSCLLPVDSEHSAVWQCLRGREDDAERIILTASGGPFWNESADAIAKAGPATALKHPNWSMGNKISIDSATMINKGLEVIEAHWLFGMPYGKIDVTVHPQSIVHSMVEFRDGSILAQIASPDMKIPISKALLYPEISSAKIAGMDFMSSHRLDFYPQDDLRFPCLPLAVECGKKGGTVPAVMNAANEEAVYAFLDGRISFSAIPDIIEDCLKKHKMLPAELENILAADREGRKNAEEIISAAGEC